MAKGKYSKKRAQKQDPNAAAPDTAPDTGAAAPEAAEQQPDAGAAQAPVMNRDDLNPDDISLIDLDFERQAAENAAGREESTYGLWKYVWRFTQWKDKHQKPHTFKKKTYMWLMLFTGWAGGHRWYQGRYILAALSTLLFWTGIPVLLLVTDFMEVYPIKPDENGYITMK